MRFYRDDLGLPLRDEDTESIAFFQTRGTWLALYPRDALAVDVGISTEGSGFSSVTLAHNVRTKSEVDELLHVAVEVGAIRVKPAADTFWRSVKGINILNCVYHAQGVTLPVAFEIVRKTIEFTDERSGQTRRRSELTKNELMRRMLSVCVHNRVEFSYVLADSWFSSKENMEFIRDELGKQFVIALKSNRTETLSYESKRQGSFQRIDTLDLPEGEPVRVWLRGLDFPVLLLRQVFTNADGSAGTLYLACSELDEGGETICAIYHRRWKVETFHKTLKSNAALAKSPTKTVRTQSNHFFMAIYSAARLEWMGVRHGLNHFALRTRIYLKAVRHAFEELQLLKAA